MICDDLDCNKAPIRNMSGTTLLSLPYVILVKIFSTLKPSDLTNLMLTCKSLRQFIINETVIWKFIFRHKLIIKDSTNSNLKSLSFFNRCRISKNWQKGFYSSKVVIHHFANYIPWLQFYNSEMLFLTVGSELKCYTVNKKGFPHCKNCFWTVDVPKVQRYDIRTNDISRFVVKDNVIVCGNRDGSTAIYTYNEKQNPRLRYHIENCHLQGNSEVSAVELINDDSSPCAITASNYSSDLCLWYWKWKDYSSNTTPLNNHTVNCEVSSTNPAVFGLRCLAVNSMQDKLAIGPNGNRLPLLFDIATCRLLITPKETKNLKHVVRDIQWRNENTIVFVSHSGTLHLVDIRTSKVVYETRDPFQSSLYCVKSDGDNAVLVGASEYSRCVLFDLRSKAHIQMYFTQKRRSPIYSLDFDATKLIAAADRGVAILNFNGDKMYERDYSHQFEFVISQ